MNRGFVEAPLLKVAQRQILARRLERRVVLQHAAQEFFSSREIAFLRVNGPQRVKDQPMIGNQAASALEALQGVVEFLSLSVGKGLPCSAVQQRRREFRR